MDAFKRMIDIVHSERGSVEGFDFAVPCHPAIDHEPYVAAGANWLVHSFWPGNRPDQVLRFIGRHTAG